MDGVDAAIEFGLAPDEAGINELTGLLCAGFPAGDYRVRWTISGSTCTIEMISPPPTSGGYGLHQVFHRLPDGMIEVDFGLYALPENLQRHGHARILVKNALLAYERIGVAAVVICANRLHGGYVWAKLRARPKDSRLCRSELLKLLRQRAASRLLNSGAVAFLKKVIEESQDADLMLNVANATYEDQPLGKDFLGGFSWGAYWSLQDEGQCAEITEALSHCG